MNKRRIGTAYEDKAAGYLEEQGVEILERNYRTHTGEIDIVAKDGQYLVFAEVKYRADGAKGTALEAVDTRKQRVIIRTARVYLYKHGLGEDTACRFDVVGIDGEKIVHIKNAFTIGD